MSNFPQASILVADSDTESLFAIASILIAQNHQVKTATSAAEASRLSDCHSLDLLICETRLPDQSGFELVERIRRSSEHVDLPVMFVTFNQSADVIRRSHETGAAFHIKKPIDPTVLCELVDKALWMPHLVKSHVEQKTVPFPHLSFAKNPMANPFDTGSILPGTPITF